MSLIIPTGMPIVCFSRWALDYAHRENDKIR